MVYAIFENSFVRNGGSKIADKIFEKLTKSLQRLIPLKILSAILDLGIFKTWFSGSSATPNAKLSVSWSQGHGQDELDSKISHTFASP